MDNIFILKSKKLPMIFQAENAECGLACMLMILGYHGSNIDIEEARSSYMFGASGVSVSDITEMAHDFSMNARVLRAEVEDLKNLKLPCILHWEMTHFVVLKKITKKYIVIHDPAFGERFISHNESSNLFTGIAVEFSPNDGFLVKPSVKTISFLDLVRSTKGLLKGSGQVIFFSFVIQSLILAAPYYIQYVVDIGISGGGQESILFAALGFGLLKIFEVSVFVMRSIIVLYIHSTIKSQLTTNLLTHMISLPSRWFETRSFGDVMSRFGSLSKVIKSISFEFVEAIVDGIMAITIFFVMLIYSPLLVLVEAVSKLTYLSYRMYIYPDHRSTSESVVVTNAKKDALFIESLRAIQPIKLFSKEAFRISQWQNITSRSINLEFDESKFEANITFIKSLCDGIAFVIIIAIAAVMAIKNIFTIGMLFAYMAWRMQFSERFYLLVDRVFEFRRLGIHLNRISDISSASPEISAGDLQCINPQEMNGFITVRNLSFKYSENTRYIIKDFNLDIRAGECVAIVARSGYGKSTLLKLMTGLLLPVYGKIEVDGKDISALGHKKYRKCIGTVMQDDTLLSGSILNNISFFEINVDMEFAIHCCKLAQVHDEIMELPMRYQTLVGDMGSSLSGGQRQRILLARALYSKPKILFLDESSSNLDAKTEKIINDNISSLGITRIVVAHRKETIEIADRVVDMESINER
jgi:ATP-binding cassette subfamily B protein RaxB